MIPNKKLILKNQLAAFSVPLTYVPVPSPIPHYIDYCGGITITEQFTNIIRFVNLPYRLEAQQG